MQLFVIVHFVWHLYLPIPSVLLSFGFVVKTFLHVRASKDSREPTKKKKIIPQSIIKWRVLCNQLLSEIQEAVSMPLAPVTTSLEPDTRGELTRDDFFQYPIRFMDSMVDISRHLATVTSDQYSK